MGFTSMRFYIIIA